MNTWVNGRATTRVDHRDRGLHYGDGVFETMRIRGRAIRLVDFHLERLAAGCRRLEIAAPPEPRLRAELARVARLRPQGIVKLIVTRGVGARGYRPTHRERATRVLSVHPLSRAAASVAHHAVRVRVCATRLGVNERLAGLKTLNRLESVLARAEWSDPRIWEGLLRDTEGHLVCGTMSNFFVRSGTSLLTPRLDRCGIAGVMRRWVMGTAAALELDVRESRLRWEDLHHMEEAFMTNAIVGIVSVASIRFGRSSLRFDDTGTARELRRRLAQQ